MTRHNDGFHVGPMAVQHDFSPRLPPGTKVPPSEIGPVHARGGSEPHPDYGGWARFLGEHCDLRRVEDGVRYFGSSNCNYILFPDGMLVENFGYHGDGLMNRVRENGAAAEGKRIKQDQEELDAIMKRVRAGL